MDKIKSAFQNKNANIGYIVAGYPSIEYTKGFLNSLDESALDIVEIGIPYSDPLADGKLISMASFHACQNGVNPDTVFDMLSQVKTSKALVFLVYYNIIFAYGEDKFIQKAIEVGMSGVIIPDLPYEESIEFGKKCTKAGLALIPLVSPTTKDRLKDILSNAKGFIYAIGSLGVTGGFQSPLLRLQDMVEAIKQNSDLPVAIGFGIKTNEDVKRTRSKADGVIVGTSIVELFGKYPLEEINHHIDMIFKD